MEILAKIFEVINNKISLAVVIFCGFLLFAPNATLEKLDILSFANSNKTTISLIFLFSAILYFSEKTKKAYHFVKRKLERRAKQKALNKALIANLAGLSLEEEAWIYYSLRGNIRTLLATEINPTAISLENKLLVYRPNTIHDRLATPFTFRIEVWDYLNQNKDRYCSPDRLNDTQFNANVDGFIASLQHV